MCIGEDIMNLSKNIFNAFEVVNKTHENVDKLIECCKVAVEEKKEYTLACPKFLRWKSDVSYWAWNLRSLILLFQRAEDQILENGWRNGPVYVMEINLYNPDVFDEPMVTLARFEYSNIASWTPNCSPADHYIFYDPLYDLEYQEIGEESYEVTVDESYGKRYWGLKSVKCSLVPLIQITSENAYEKIFGSFNLL